jgi:hypothetical protein
MSPAAAALAAAGVGFGHAILPDHWVPLAVIGRTERYPLRRVAKLSAAAGVTHVAVSMLLGAIVVGLGLGLRSTVSHVQDAVIGGLLIATGVAFVGLQLAGRGHTHDHEHHHHHDHHHDHRHERRRLLSVIVPFGAAASPDLTILPVFLAAAAASTAAAVGALIAFAAVTIATILGLTLFATAGGYQIRGEWLDRWGHAFTAAVLLVIGALVLAGIL